MAITFRQGLIGCAVGCGTIVLVLVALGVGFAVWLNRSGELFEPERLLGSDTVGFVEWELRLEDPGTAGFVVHAIEALDELQQRGDTGMPPWLQAAVSRQRSRALEKDVRDMFPLAVAWTLRSDEGGANDLHLITASLASYGNQVVFGDWLLGWFAGRLPGWRQTEHRGERIYQFPMVDRRVTFFVRGNDVFIASDIDTAVAGVDRVVTAERGPRRPTDVDRLFRRTGSDRRLRGALTNTRGEARRVWELLGGLVGRQPAWSGWEGLRGVTLAGGLEADGSLSGSVEFLGSDPSWAGAHAGTLASAVEELAPTKLVVEVNGRTDGDAIVLDVRVPDLVDQLSSLAESAIQSVR